MRLLKRGKKPFIEWVHPRGLAGTAMSSAVCNAMNTRNVLLVCLAMLCLAAKPRSQSRSRPPVKWEKGILAVFEDDAYSLLQGPRPHSFSNQEMNLGSTPEPREEEEEAFDRSSIMKQLRAAEASLAEGLNNPKALTVAATQITASANLMERLGRTLFSSDPDYGDEDYYLKQAEEMTSAARLIKVYASKGDYEGAQRTMAALKNSCDRCHTRFR